MLHKLFIQLKKFSDQVNMVRLIAGHTVSFQEHRRVMQYFIDQRVGHFFDRLGA
jgi:hypothetical protein